jgi:hypothetical protein
MLAILAVDRERADALGSHVSERDGLDSIAVRQCSGMEILRALGARCKSSTGCCFAREGVDSRPKDIKPPDRRDWEASGGIGASPDRSSQR